MRIKKVSKRKLMKMLKTKEHFLVTCQYIIPKELKEYCELNNIEYINMRLG